MAIGFHGLFATHEAEHHDLVFGGLSLLIGSAVFAVDMFTGIEGAVAVLYSIALLFAAQAANRKGLMALSAAFIALTLFAFFFGHGPDPDMQAFLRLVVALASLAVTTALLVRNDEAKAELLRMNSALRESETRYRSIFHGTRVALWERDYSRLRHHLVSLKARGISDIKLHARDNPEFIRDCIQMIEIVAANAAANDLLGATPDHPSNCAMAGYIPPDSAAITEVLQAIMDGASHLEHDAEVISENGETKSVLLSIGFPDDTSAFNRVVVSMVDVTQREEARKTLAEAQAELSRASKAATVGVLSASLAHELNQPLGAIVVNSQTLLRWLAKDPPDLEATRRSAERILRDGNRASEIIKNTRSMLSATPPEAEHIDLNALLSETLTLMEHDLQRERTAVEIIQEEEIPSVPGIKIEMQQVLINLISNAAHAIAAAAAKRRLVTITLKNEHDGEHVLISVRDTGNGLDLEAARKIFTPFFTTKKNGMGMGLSICRSAIEARGGTLEARNHPEGGALFEIRLPKEKADA
ncbi:GHKL domain-containing protein (plasmid) [Rhizobium grahamii]|uniref:histidine kinase n=1 Tax=Rhizobium grahamii TaxID=1120045 RepID=A0A5Q0CE93_9HYPH|nr:MULTISPECIES: ATP-binding protein [Rhizobium]QFY63615.1 GHKL domain-containing protein [Rhizobium grahamii]QRM51620.1 GHKL domain-containing protein [Rhizobium sp. BG6]